MPAELYLGEVPYLGEFPSPKETPAAALAPPNTAAAILVPLDLATLEYHRVGLPIALMIVSPNLENTFHVQLFAHQSTVQNMGAWGKPPNICNTLCYSCA